MRKISAVAFHFVTQSVERGRMSLEGVDWSLVDSKSTWRRHVRYVTQYKVDIAGTPIDFVKRISSFKAWQANTQSSPASEH
jgi:hypothetical protein